jgi:small-conductance mechanosensitive channel
MNDWAELLRRATERMIEQGAILAPRFVVFAVLFVGGLLAAFVLQGVVRALLRRAGLDRIAEHTGVGRTLARLGYANPASHLAGFVVFWTVLGVFLLTAADSLGLPAVSQSIAQVIGSLPTLAVVVLILLIGFSMAGAAQRTIEGVAERSRMISARALGQLAYYLVGALFTVIALSGLGVDFTIVITVIGVLLAAIGTGLAVTVALGARRVAQNTIGGVYARRDLRVGDRIKVGELEGDVAAVGQVFLTLRDGDRTWLVPYEQVLSSVIEVVRRATP